ncbi:MAG: hypothetical protein H7Y17_13220 [Chlorobia bacterium]|nr:hypothetical protein [Fimbriimonadaceae bacterium]
MDIFDLVEYARKQIKPLNADRWTAKSHSGKSIKVTGHSVGIDISRGPWIKFAIEEDGKALEVQGYESWNGSDRIKFGAKGKTKECEEDRIAFTGAVDLASQAVNIIVRLTFEQDDLPYVYRFEGKTN